MNYNGFYIDDGHLELPKEQMAKIAKDLQENSPMHDINKHYIDEISLLNAMMGEIKKQAVDSDKKHKQAMTKANWQIFWAIAAVVVGIIAVVVAIISLVVSISPSVSN